MYARPAHLKDRLWQQKYFEALGMQVIFRNAKDIDTLELMFEEELHVSRAIGGNLPASTLSKRDPRHWETTLKRDLAIDPDYLMMTLEKIQKDQGPFYRPINLNLKDRQALRRSLNILYVLLMGMVIVIAPCQVPSIEKWCWRAMLQTILVAQETLILEQVSISRLLHPGGNTSPLK